MSLLRLTPRTLYTRRVRHAQAIYIPRRQFAYGVFGGNTANSKGKEFNKQDPNPSADYEHISPPRRKQGYNSGSTTTKGHNTSQKQWDQKKSFPTLARRQFNTGPAHLADGVKDSRPKSTDHLSPKILNESPPPEDKVPEDVKKHNEEMEHRAERPHEKARNEDVEKDKVGKEFWSGEFVQGAVLHVTVGAIVALLIEYW
jgi:hypothetical protein